MSVLE